MIKTYLFTEKEAKKDVPLDNWRELVEGDCNLLWVDARSLTPEDLDILADKFGLHAVALHSCLDPFRRPHLYEFHDHFYINLTVVGKSSNNHGFKATELHLFAGEKFIITATKDKKNEVVDEALQNYIESPWTCSRGSIYAVYLLAEDLVEIYFPLVEKLDDEADHLEDLMLEKADKESLKRLTTLKRRTFELRKYLGPQRDIFSELSRRDFPFMTGENYVYFQDVYNRMIRIFDMIDTIREILSGSLDIYLSSVSNRLNEVVKVLTIASIVLMTMALITGFYGMNFVHLPWLRSPNAFRNVLIFMGTVTLAMFLWFKRKDWI
ncbi:MAG: magnesium/cobalt transporter CorA [Armatimonadota bacterium]|nr:magnesium/cobalt transporter CorA [Armatimonadota bacterium]